MRKSKGITLIALVITIIILLILAGVSLNLISGSDGILKKAETAQIKTDIEQTREQIQLEIMGDLDEATGKYTNDDVISAVKKVTGYDVEINAEKVQSKKGNEVDISDLWLTEIIFNLGDLEVVLPEVTDATQAFGIWLLKWGEEIGLQKSGMDHFYGTLGNNSDFSCTVGSRPQVGLRYLGSGYLMLDRF